MLNDFDDNKNLKYGILLFLASMGGLLLTLVFLADFIYGNNTLVDKDRLELKKGNIVSIDQFNDISRKLHIDNGDLIYFDNREFVFKETTEAFPNMSEKVMESMSVGDYIEYSIDSKHLNEGYAAVYEVKYGSRVYFKPEKINKVVNKNIIENIILSVFFGTCSLVTFVTFLWAYGDIIKENLFRKSKRINKTNLDSITLLGILSTIFLMRCIFQGGIGEKYSVLVPICFIMMVITMQILPAILCIRFLYDPEEYDYFDIRILSRKSITADCFILIDAAFIAGWEIERNMILLVIRIILFIIIEILLHQYLKNKIPRQNKFVASVTIGIFASSILFFLKDYIWMIK